MRDYNVPYDCEDEKDVYLKDLLFGFSKPIEYFKKDHHNGSIHVELIEDTIIYTNALTGFDDIAADFEHFAGIYRVVRDDIGKKPYLKQFILLEDELDACYSEITETNLLRDHLDDRFGDPDNIKIDMNSEKKAKLWKYLSYAASLASSQKNNGTITEPTEKTDTEYAIPAADRTEIYKHIKEDEAKNEAIKIFD